MTFITIFGDGYTSQAQTQQGFFDSMNAPYNVCIMFISHILISKTVLQQTNHPSTENFALIRSLSDSVLCAAANAAYLNLGERELGFT
jgi:hypothetical protein